MKRRPRNVSAPELRLSQVASGSVHVKDRAIGKLSIPRASNLLIEFGPNAGAENTTPLEGAFEFGLSPDQSISANGGSTNTVSSAVTAGATSLSVTASIGPGYYILGSRNRLSTDSGSRFQSDGEIVYVTSTGTTATLSAPTVKAYDSGSNIRYITESTGVVGLNNQVVGGTFRSSNNTSSGAPWTVAFQTQIGLKVQNINAIGGRVDCVRTLLCQNFTMSNIQITDCQSPDSTVTGVGYGLAINWSNRGTITSVSALNSRHTLGYHRLCHNITATGVSGNTTSWVFDVHDGGENLSCFGITVPYKTFSDNINRVSKDYGKVSIGNTTHVNLPKNVTVGIINAGDVFVNYACENLTLTGDNCRRLWFVQVNVTGYTNATASSFKTSTLNINRHGLANSSSVDTGETCVDDITSLSTTRFGTNSSTIASFDRVRVRGSSECFQPSHGVDGRAVYQGSWTDYSFRVDTGDVRVKAGLGSGGHPVRFLGFGSTLSTPQRMEFEGVDFYHNANVTIAVASDVATTDLTVAASGCEFSVNGGALAALNTTNNISTTVTRSGTVTAGL